MSSRPALAEPGTPVPARAVVLLGALGVALFLAALDQTVFAAALPTIVGDLHGGARLAWVNTAYVLAATLAMPAYGRVGDAVGDRPAVLAAVGLFVAGSVVAGLATHVDVLVAGRVVQGLGGGGLLVLVQSIIARVVPARRRPPVMAAVGAVFGIASVAGPPLGGWITQALGWRWAFWINVPLGVAVLVATIALLPPATPGRVRAARVGTFAVLAHRNVALAAVAGLLLAVAMFGVVGYLPTWWQLAAGLDPEHAGLAMLALMGGLAATTLGSAWFVRRTGRYRRVPFAGALAVAAALAVLSRVDPHDVGLAAAALALLGAGIGCTWDVLVLVVQNSAPDEAVTTATATYSFAREVGVTAGTALVGALFAGRAGALLAQRAPGLDPDGLSWAVLAGLPAPQQAAVAGAYRDALAPIFAGLVPMVLVGALALWFLWPEPLATTTPATPGEVAP